MAAKLALPMIIRYRPFAIHNVALFAVRET